MKRILVTGALGQIGSELCVELRRRYGPDNVVVSDLRAGCSAETLRDGPYERLDCLEASALAAVVKRHRIDTIYHLAALLSAVAETRPQAAWKVNIDGLVNVLEVAREMSCAVFVPSSIGAFGPTTPKDPTPQDTVQRPTSMYGVTKVCGELLCDYYHLRFGVDTRGVRYPGIISYGTPPGGGTTDYAVDIYHQALREGSYTCYLRENTFLDMMYMPDALRAAIDVMEADPARLKHRNAFNVTAMSVCPRMIAKEIQKHVPDFKVDYQIDPVRQAIADSWPNRLDDRAARDEWGFQPRYDLGRMTQEMLTALAPRYRTKS